MLEFLSLSSSMRSGVFRWMSQPELEMVIGRRIYGTLKGGSKKTAGSLGGAHAQ